MHLCTYDFEERQLEAIAAFRANRQIGEYEETCIFTAILVVFEMVERRDDGTGGVARFAVFQEMKLLVRVWGCEGSEHEVVRVLEES